MSQKALFLEFSASLTGYSQLHLAGTGIADDVWDMLGQQVGDSLRERLIETWQAIRHIDDPDELNDAIRHDILSSSEFGGPARNIIKMWYLGQWDVSPPYDYQIISSEAYVEGLVWDAIGAHPMGAKQPGFGTWAFPPGSLDGAPVSIGGRRS